MRGVLKGKWPPQDVPKPMVSIKVEAIIFNHADIESQGKVDEISH